MNCLQSRISIYFPPWPGKGEQVNFTLDPSRRVEELIEDG